jgi:hypothetical protein
MKSQKGDERRERQRRDCYEEEEDRLPVPASAARVVLGIVTMLSGFLFGGLAGDSWWALPGIAVMLLSPVIMLKWPKN